MSTAASTHRLHHLLFIAEDAKNAHLCCFPLNVNNNRSEREVILQLWWVCVAACWRKGSKIKLYHPESPCCDSDFHNIVEETPREDVLLTHTQIDRLRTFFWIINPPVVAVLIRWKSVSEVQSSKCFSWTGILTAALLQPNVIKVMCTILKDWVDSCPCIGGARAGSLFPPLVFPNKPPTTWTLAHLEDRREND